MNWIFNLFIKQSLATYIRTNCSWFLGSCLIGCRDCSYFMCWQQCLNLKSNFPFMNSIELRPDIKKFAGPIAIMILGLLGSNYFAFIDKRFHNNLFLKVFAVALSIFILYFIYKFLSLIRKINRQLSPLPKPVFNSWKMDL
jgi:hypothetical protein